MLLVVLLDCVVEKFESYSKCCYSIVCRCVSGQFKYLFIRPFKETILGRTIIPCCVSSDEIHSKSKYIRKSCNSTETYKPGFSLCEGGDDENFAYSFPIRLKLYFILARHGVYFIKTKSNRL